MTNDIVEADQPMGTAAAVIEKAARQLVYDSRYKVSQKLGKKKKDIDPRAFDAMVLQQISKSQGPAVARAKQMLLKKRGSVREDFIFMMEDAAVNSVANAMFKVFVEGVKKEEIIELPYETQLSEEQERKYKIRVTDLKTGNSYVRYGTREKITQLRAKGLKVEMTEHGEPREGERKRGEETARATGGGRPGRKKLDPVGREDSDVDNDGKPNDSNDKYIMKRRAAIGAAIEKRKTVSASYEIDGQMIDESEIGDRARKVVGDQRSGVHGDADAMKQDMDAININLRKLRGFPNGFPSVKKETTKTTQVAHYEPDSKLVESKKSKKHKKTDEPRWQDSDGDNKWYEPEDVKKEDYLWTEGTTSTEGQNTKKIDVMKNGEMNKVTVFPQDSADPQAPGSTISAGFEAEGPILTEKAVSKAQQRFMAMVYSRKKGKMKKGEASPEVEAAAKSMTKKEAKKFAKTKHKGLPGHVKEAADCGSDDKEKERDTRGDYAKINMVKNKLRAMGAKNPIVMVASEQHRPPAGWKPYGGTPEEHESQKRSAEAWKELQGGWLERKRNEGRSQVKPAD